MNRYARNRAGEVIHHINCVHRGETSVPWDYADGMTNEDIVRKTAECCWLRACQFCRPDLSSIGVEEVEP